MAYLIYASCWICGEELEGLVFGGGMKDHTPIVPALEKATNKVVAVAYGDHDHYRYYTDPAMYERDEEVKMIHPSLLHKMADTIWL